MRLDNVDLNLFVVLNAVYQEGSVSKAAERLSITQPAISNALARLRQSFNDPLFIRSSEGMLPTPICQNMICDVQKALTLLGQCKPGDAIFDASQAVRTFRLAMNDLAEAILLPPLMQKIMQTAPGIQIHCYYHDRESAVDELRSGKCDLLLDAPVFNPRGLQTSPLTTLDYLVTMRRGHPLAGHSLSLADYLSAQHLHVSSRRKGRGQVDIALHHHGVNRHIQSRLQNYQVAARVVANTDLLWTAPRPMAKMAALSFCTPPFKVEPLVWHMFWRQNFDSDPANAWLRLTINQTVKEVIGNGNAVPLPD